MKALLLPNYTVKGGIVNETQNPPVVEKKPNVSTSVPDLRNIQEDLHSAVTILESAITKLESLPNNHSRVIWKNIIIAVREDINRYATKLLDLTSGTSKAGKS